MSPSSSRALATYSEWLDPRFRQLLVFQMAFGYAYSALILRVLGVAPGEAQRLAARMGTAPPFLAPIGRDIESGATMEEVALKSGPATLVQQTGAAGAPRRTTIVWSVPDRVYALSGTLRRELAIAAADAVE